ncbi:hypothetical protein [Streptomyces cavernae]|uniref:hypothetical protein n=1 Tax=Streptomyces cavernae TaxID=2259034 RepID=UPI0012D9DC04|nr:hypothetical protein [Streptomyces cavernae]
MRVRRATVALAGVAAAFLVPVIATPAAAATADVGCSMSAGRGTGSWTWASKTKLTNVHLWAKDTDADGWHPAIRLVTVTANNEVKHWGWRHVYGGSGAIDSWDTYAEDSRGIKRASIEVGTFNGTTFLQAPNCGSVGPLNPFYA